MANLFLHYVFDEWMDREFPGCPFERYVDDAVIHCRSLEQAQVVLDALRSRMAEAGLELHPDKTKIVYCQDSNRRGSGPGPGYPHTQFTFLGFTFRPRRAVNKNGVHFTSFQPAISREARLKAFFSRQWQQMPAAHFMAVFGPYATRIQHVLDRFDPAVLASAAHHVEGQDDELPLRPEEMTA